MELSTFLWLGLAIVLFIVLRGWWRRSPHYTTGFAGEPVPLAPPEPRYHEREAHAPQEVVDLLTNGRQHIADAHARKLAHAARVSGDMDIQFTRAEHNQRVAWRALLNQADMRFGRKDVDRALREIGMSRW